MEKRHHINQNIKELVPQALLVSQAIFSEPSQAKQLVIDSLSVLSIETKGRFLAHPVSKTLNYRVLEVMSRLLKHKKSHLADKEFGFYNLQPFERFLLILKYRVGISQDEICEVTKLPSEVVADKLYQAKVHLEKYSELCVGRA